MFEMFDHAYEPIVSSGQPGYTADQLCIDKCAFPGCGKSELEHEWTVDAYMSNRQELQT